MVHVSCNILNDFFVFLVGGHTDYVFRLYAIRENKTGTEGIPAILNVMTIDARKMASVFLLLLLLKMKIEQCIDKVSVRGRFV